MSDSTNDLLTAQSVASIRSGKRDSHVLFWMVEKAHPFRLDYEGSAAHAFPPAGGRDGEMRVPLRRPAPSWGRTLFPLWFSKVFLPISSIRPARVHGADRRTRTCVASRGPLPSGRGAPWNGSPPRPPGTARGARIHPRNLDFPLGFKGF